MITNRKHAVTLTPRGFALYGTFADAADSTVRVVESSSAQQNAVWVFCQSADRQDYPLLLTRPGALALIEALQRFLADEAEAEPSQYGPEEEAL